MIKRLLLIVTILLLIINVRAAYFEKLPYIIKQPDGKTINCFVSGDEFFNWIHDEQGYTIIQAPNGYYYYAVFDGEILKPSRYIVNSVNPARVGLKKWAKISKAEYQRKYDAMFAYKFESNKNTGPNKAPHSGIMNNIVVYIRFSDDTEFTTTRQVYEDKFNPSTGVSLKSYYKEVSYNNLTINSTHYPDCELSTNLSYQDSHSRNYFLPYNATTNPIGYNGGGNGEERRIREHQLLVDAINWININSPVHSSLNIDGDGDDNVDNVCFIIKGSSGGWNDLLWAHRWTLFSQNIYINGKKVYDYTFQPEGQVAVQTICHEMFHALGSPDLYHYTSNGIAPVSSWDLMESGGGHMLVYMKWKYSNHTWINTIPEITTTGTYTLNPVTSSTNNCYKIASPFSTNEYFMIEYRNKSGTFESNIPGSGLIVYRIDESVSTGNRNGPPDEVYVFRPNGTISSNGTPSNAFFSSTVGRTAINDTTNPKCFLQNGTKGGINISNVSTAGTTISFNVTFPPPCNSPAIQASAFTSSALTNNSMTIGWTRGTGDSVLIIAKAGSATTILPYAGSSYTANAIFGLGTQLGTGNYVVYNGTGTSVNITALT
ncbi:MAG: M6 family metalloprotease domain-containing protein, partial [Bacteroidales bacterium]